MEFLHNLLWFIVAVGILVTVHEFGHFWVARKMGVKVLRFSVGFGKPLYKLNGKDGTEYVVAAIPLGGYVRMFGEQGDAVTDSNRHQAFNFKSLKVKTAIVAAGPLCNFFFAIIAYWLIFVAGVPGQMAMIGGIVKHSIADRAGMRPNEVIIAVNDRETPTWSVVNNVLLDAALSDNKVDIRTKSAGRQALHQYHLIIDDSSALIDENGVIQNLGIQVWRPPVWIGTITPDSAAAAAGFQKGDKVLAADGEPVLGWSDWVAYIRARPGIVLTVDIERNDIRHVIIVTPKAVMDSNGETIGRIGVGRHIPEEVLRQHTSKVQYGPLPAFGHALLQTWEFSSLILRMLGRMIVGDVSTKNVSGPITIAQYAGLSADLGWLEYVRMLAIISISLGVLNLLPIPMLDGGHLLYYAVEFIRGGPLPEQVYTIGQQVGVFLLVLLMGLAFYNDFSRLFG